jgi:GT2 family glycosyltransferase
LYKFVVLSYNHPTLTQKAVVSVLSKVPSEKILLFHNGSLLEHQEQLRTAFPQIEHISTQQNKGFSGGANLALKAAFKNTDWVLFMTNDCELLDVGQLPSEPSITAPLILNKNQNKVDSLGGLYHFKKAKLSHCKEEGEFIPQKNIYPYVPGTAFWIHKNIFDTLGGFDETLHTYWEDVDFSVRAQKRGFKLNIDQTTRFLHKVGKTCHKDSFYTSYLFQRNRLIVSKKYSSKFNLNLYSSLSLQILRQIKNRRWKNLKLLTKAILEA